MFGQSPHARERRVNAAASFDKSVVMQGALYPLVGFDSRGRETRQLRLAPRGTEISCAPNKPHQPGNDGSQDRLNQFESPLMGRESQNEHVAE
jgi:hypothetical protein